MKIYKPTYTRSPNKLLKYIERPFDDGVGHTGVERVAVFLDKNGKQCEMTAQMLWIT